MWSLSNPNPLPIHQPLQKPCCVAEWIVRYYT